MLSIEALGRQESSVKTEFDLSKASIFQLSQLIEKHPNPEIKEIFDRIFTVVEAKAPVAYDSEEASNYVQGVFKTAGRITERYAITIHDNVRAEAAKFNPLRAKRPFGKPIETNVNHPENIPLSECSFCNYKKRTPKDEFGRIEGEYWVTASNAGAYAGWNSFAIQKEAHPPRFDKDIFSDLFAVHKEWVKKIKDNHFNSQTLYASIGCNCGPRAGESIPHLHAQFILETIPFIKYKLLIERTNDYKRLVGKSYFDDLTKMMETIGLVKRVGNATIMFNLTPAKEKELVILCEDEQGFPNGDLAKASSLILDWWKNGLGVNQFNFSIFIPPINQDFSRETKTSIPVFMRMVDRGNGGSSDYGWMEYSGEPVVACDPFILAWSFKEFCSQKVVA